MARSPYGLEIIENCFTCPLRLERLFCNLSTPALKALEAIKYSAAYPRGAVLFVEGQSPRGVYVMCSGRAKLSTCSSEGKALILKIAGPGEVLGLSATVSGKAYEVTVEMLDPSQVNFIKRDDFLRFLREHGEAALRVAQQLSSNYHSAYEEIRSLGLSRSAAEKLARLILEWSQKNGSGEGKPSKAPENRVQIALTHEEIAQMIGTSRETVSRLLADFKKRQVIQLKGSSLFIRDRAALQSLVGA